MTKNMTQIKIRRRMRCVALCGNWSRSVASVLAVVVVIAGLTFLYIWSPSEISYFPRCPFLALTGYQCPGCGTLRGIHALLHFRIVDALRYNLLMVASIPVILLMLIWSRFRFDVISARVILAVTLFWWLIRNII